MNKNLSDIQRDVRSSFINFSHIQEVHQLLAELVEADYGRGEPDIVFVLGAPGTGKTWLVKRFADNYPRRVMEQLTEVPVLIVNVPHKCTVKRLCGAMLQALGSPLWDEGDEEQRTFQLQTLLARCRVRLVILNEANHLVDRGRDKSHYVLGDWIKLLSETTGVPMALVGISRAKVLLQVNEQLADRVLKVVTIEPFGVDPRCTNQMSTALSAYDRLLEGMDRIALAHEDNARRFAFATDGRLRRIRILLQAAIREASKDKHPKLSLPVLARAFSQSIFSGAPDERNPFVPEKFSGKPLTGPGEPYAPNRKTREEADA